MLLVLAVALGGAAGALSRYGLDRFIEHHLLTVFPWSTFVINITGCFAAGLAVAMLVDRHDVPTWVRTGVVVGFLGAYTTFSTFAQETHDLFSEGHAALGIADAAGSIVVGVAAVVGGIALGRAL
ncbi:MAG TPA: fluoride efflux transporter CrcB [Gaiellaceae bacterium]|nr:fluoride efflux transporter CrcB [Gaiellaceae bacterium]